MYITSEDIFNEFLKFCKKADKKAVLKEYGGSNIYIPSYKNSLRDEDILKEYEELVASGFKKTLAVKKIARKYELTNASVYRIVKPHK
ncbi:hypothetical protein CBLAS_0903 [Campylobacter blaseri]|uniref:DNA-binding protein n=1 Tax=Campylobacter blaseri TaxID=2042961 RepID=A0A2P8R2Q2_9BACT|nr:Mor transcription activator family protein [Campylobacter blaseri]PSM52775.1 DNA-binding protein [Campylobacter blaseri]PSM54423.1 DNA-binding protein [Campylobacter blaseri]QKF86088.1 hypothetical protein CBLAS_0903 [Campylobacter blaseri]